MSTPYILRFLHILLICLSTIHCQSEIDSGLTKVNSLLYQQDYVEAEMLLNKLRTQIERTGPELSDIQNTRRLKVLDRLGKVYALYLRNYKKAIEHYNVIVQDYPQTNEAFAARNVLADLYHHKLDNIDNAISQYRKLLEIFPKKHEAPEIQMQLVRLYIESKDFEQARSDVQTFLAQWPKNKYALHAEFQIGMTYYLESRYSEAITSFEALLKKSQHDPDLSALISFELGNSYESLDEPEKALEQFYACLAKHPNPLLVQRRIRRARKRIRQVKPSARIYSQYTSPAPLSPANTTAQPPPETTPVVETTNTAEPTTAEPQPTNDKPATPLSAPVNEPPAAKPDIPEPIPIPAPAPVPTAPEKKTEEKN